MPDYEVYLDSIQKYPTSIFFTKNTDWGTFDDFEVILPAVDLTIDMESTVDIYRDGIKKFRGVVEKISEHDTGDGGTDYILSGRDKRLSAKDRLVAGRQLFTTKDPATIVQSINGCGILLDLQPTKLTFHPDADMFIQSATPTVIPSQDWELRCQWEYPPLDKNRGLVHFELQTILAAISSITTATLRLHCHETLRGGSGSGFNTRTRELYKIGADWDELVTWATKPGHAASYIGTWTSTFGSEDTWYEVNVKTDVDTWLAGTAVNYGWMFEDPAEAVTDLTGYWYDAYGSRESGIPPELFLEVVYTTGTSTSCSASLVNADAWKAIDDSVYTYWDSGQAQANAQWFKLDLGVARTLTRIVIEMVDPDYAKHFVLEHSLVDAGYTALLTKNDYDASTIDIAFTGTSMRYIQLRITDSDAAHLHIKDIQVYLYSATGTYTEGEIGTFGKTTDFRVDYEDQHQAIKRMIAQIGWEAWLGLDDKINMGVEQGTDVSGTVEFESGRNLYMNDRKRLRPYARSVTILGHGEGSQQLRVTKTTGTGLPQRVFEFKDLISLEGLNFVATFLLNELSQEDVIIEGDVDDEFETGAWSAGDYVWFTDPQGLSTKLRVRREMRGYTPESGEAVNIILGKRKVCLPNILQIMNDNIGKWARVNQSLTARSEAE